MTVQSEIADRPEARPDARPETSRLLSAGNRSGLLNAQMSTALEREVASVVASVTAIIDKMPAKSRTGASASAEVYINRIQLYMDEAARSRGRVLAAHQSYQDERMRLILASKNLGAQPAPKKGRVGDMKDFHLILDHSRAMADALDERALASEAVDRMAVEIRTSLSELVALTSSGSVRGRAMTGIMPN